MSEDNETKASINPRYVLGQLCRAITAAEEHPDIAVRQRAIKRITAWEQVFAGMLKGTVSIGTRAPVHDVPAWVTIEVVQGGFATGNLMAAGTLQSHELELLARLDRPADNTARAALNIYYLSDSGQKDLCEMMQTGRYRVNVPEEGALLVIAWLLSHEVPEKAQELIDCITPFFDRLRFYPVPDQNPAVPSPTVHRHTIQEIITRLSDFHTQVQVEKMRESLQVWQPLYDRAVSLFIETIEDDFPCRRFPAGWHTRAQALLDEYSSLRKVHGLCGKPERPKENFARLRGYMKICIDNPPHSAHTPWAASLTVARETAARLFGAGSEAEAPQLQPRDIGMIRHILRGYVKRHGEPGSERLVQRRKMQARIANLPTRDHFEAVLLTRLEKFPGDSSIANLDPVLSPVTNDESAAFKMPSGSIIPESLVRKMRRCWDAPIEQLVEQGVIPSGDVLAQVLPQITSQVRAAAIADRDLRGLYSAIYSAFRRRRSLLLLNLERQVRLEDLPWIAALDSFRQDDLDTKEQARQTLEQVTTIALVSFPHAILPNKLLQELRTLITAAGLSIPIVDELAADIFMGAFSEKFTRAAQIAGKMLRGTLYERYFGLPYDKVLQWSDDCQGSDASGRFATLCETLAQVEENESWSASRNGRVIEQCQILTTHNLAALFQALDLQSTLSGRLLELSERCFRWICDRRLSTLWRANLHMVKKSAYAWRQMLFFLALLDPQVVSAFLLWARNHLAQQDLLTANRLNPALSGLEWIVQGGTFDQHGIGGPAGKGRRVIGWTRQTRN